MSRSLLIQPRPDVRGVDVPQLRRALRLLLQDLLEVDRFDLAIYLVRAPEMAALNRKFLQHEGSTDVITFDYAERPNKPQRRAGVSPAQAALHGEIFVCVDDAVWQSPRFRTPWTSELARYVIHGVLHLLGHDDSRPAARRKMKREENRLLREMARRFPLRKLGRDRKLAG